ncbi:MAG TPA: GNAT family N-acetyltransferase [Cryomorphaceae bacterium]|nr:GNAT family N-acetyltransferase [Cryomorphaceae bacterium]|tara:strand:- start:470 stop:985 length:516 start_codon:yes stop_codon:yes gene_type:complete
MIQVGDIGVLRALEPSDLDWIYAVENDASLWYLGISKEPWSKAVLSSYIDAQPGNLLRDGQLRLLFEVDGIPVGTLDVYDYDPIARKGGIGIVLSPEARGKGWAKLALEAFKQYLFGTLGMHMLYAVVPQSNPASQTLFESLLFEHSGVFKHWIMREGQFEDAHLYQLIHS